MTVQNENAAVEFIPGESIADRKKREWNARPELKITADGHRPFLDNIDRIAAGAVRVSMPASVGVKSRGEKP